MVTGEVGVKLSTNLQQMEQMALEDDLVDLVWSAWFSGGHVGTRRIVGVI